MLIPSASVTTLPHYTAAGACQNAAINITPTDYVGGVYSSAAFDPTGVQTSDAPTVQGQMGRTVIYCNRVVRTYLDLQAMNKTNVLLELRQFEGEVVTTFRGIRVELPARTRTWRRNRPAVTPARSPAGPMCGPWA